MRRGLRRRVIAAAQWTSKPSQSRCSARRAAPFNVGKLLMARVSGAFEHTEDCWEHLTILARWCFAARCVLVDEPDDHVQHDSANDTDWIPPNVGEGSQEVFEKVEQGSASENAEDTDQA